MSAIKSLSLTQPYASLVAASMKLIESRSWATRFRGELAIHAAKGFPREYRDLCETEPFTRCLEAAGFGGWRDLPRGAMLAVVTLYDCRPTSCDQDLVFDPGSGLWDPEWLEELTDQEFAFGNYEPGRWGWFMRDVRPLPQPVPAVGQLGLWEFDPAAAVPTKDPAGLRASALPKDGELGGLFGV